MDKMDLLLSLCGYKSQANNIKDKQCQSYFKWCNESHNISIAKPLSSSITIPPFSQKEIFNSTILSGVSTFDLTKKINTTQLYVLTYKSGTLPTFTTPKIITFDNTSEIKTVHTNVGLAFVNANGTPVTSDIQIGDIVVIGTGFAVENQGSFTVTSKSNSIFTVDNVLGVEEQVLMDDVQLSAYTTSPVNVGDLLSLKNDSWGSVHNLEIVSVTPTTLTFNSPRDLEDVQDIEFAYDIYDDIKNVVYIEVSDVLLLNTDTIKNMELKSMVANTSSSPGVYLAYSPVIKLSLTNNSNKAVTVFYVIAE